MKSEVIEDVRNAIEPVFWNFEGISEGVENTNFKITTTANNFILTIFEKRINEQDLPFFIQLTKKLYEKKFLCPKPISNKKNIYINWFTRSKRFTVFSIDHLGIRPRGIGYYKEFFAESAKIYHYIKIFVYNEKYKKKTYEKWGLCFYYYCYFIYCYSYN